MQTLIVLGLVFIGIIVLGLFVADYYIKCDELKKIKRAYNNQDKFIHMQEDLINELTPKRDIKGRFIKK